MEDDLKMMADDLVMMEDGLQMLEEDMETKEDDLEVMEDVQKCLKIIQAYVSCHHIGIIPIVVTWNDGNQPAIDGRCPGKMEDNPQMMECGQKFLENIHKVLLLIPM
jgi:hypothetical protein